MKIMLLVVEGVIQPQPLLLGASFLGPGVEQWKGAASSNVEQSGWSPGTSTTQPIMAVSINWGSVL